MGTPRDTVYPWGKGAHKQKSEHCRLRKCDFKSEVCDAFSPLNGRAKNPRLFGGFAELTKNPKNKWGPRGILCTRGGKSKTKKQGEFLKYQELTRVFLEISLKNKQ